MDLHFTNAAATAEERAAIDAAIARFDGTAPRRSHLLAVLHAIQNRAGWISPGALNYACGLLGMPPAEGFGVADFYALFSTREQAPAVAHICDDVACRARGAEKLCAEMEKEHGPAGTYCDGKMWKRSPCLGMCERAPAAFVSVAGPQPIEQALGTAHTADIEAALQGKKFPAAGAGASAPQWGQKAEQGRLKLLRRVGQTNPDSIEAFRDAGGFAALERAVAMGPAAVVAEVLESKLAGRGGAAFPTGLKWKSAREGAAPRYLVCNADESEPGTFKDRVVMEGDPFALVEAMIIAGFAAGCERGYIYLRGEYPDARRQLERAIRECSKHGFLGGNILGRGVRFEIEVCIGAGAYICGEETALLNSIEGHRGEPRNKPPFPTQVGLFGRPTVINNVETLLNIPHIVLEGGKAFAGAGTERSAGTKLFCLSGHVGRPGVYEAPFGITLRELLELAGGIGGTGKLQAVLVGGAAGAFLAPGELDTPLTFEGLRAAGAALGSAVVIPLDDSVDLREVLQGIGGFFRDESCGQCVPCRVGTVRQEEILRRLAAGKPVGSVASELAVLKEVGQAMRDASICGLGQTASSAVESALSKFAIFKGRA
jgi:NADH-quinone oxidoreductase subunit F